MAVVHEVTLARSSELRPPRLGSAWRGGHHIARVRTAEPLMVAWFHRRRLSAPLPPIAINDEQRSRAAARRYPRFLSNDSTLAQRRK